MLKFSLPHRAKLRVSYLPFEQRLEGIAVNVAREAQILCTFAAPGGG